MTPDTMVKAMLLTEAGCHESVVQPVIPFSKPGLMMVGWHVARPTSSNVNSTPKALIVL